MPIAVFQAKFLQFRHQNCQKNQKNPKKILFQDLLAEIPIEELFKIDLISVDDNLGLSIELLRNVSNFKFC